MKFYIKNKFVGEANGDIYTTKRSAKEHYYRKGQGYPISVSILDKLKQIGVKYIMIKEYDRYDGIEKKYLTFVSSYDYVKPFKEGNFDEQKCIMLKNMEELE